MTIADPDLGAAIAATRFGIGARAGEIDAMRDNPRGRLKAQIRPGGADQPQGALDNGRDALAQMLMDRDRGVDPDAARAARQAISDVLLAELQARAALQIATPDGFRERWAMFWTNHFTVSATKGRVAPLAGAFEREAVRPHIFGPFEDLLLASTHHPAMLLYLDQTQSAGPDSPAGRGGGAGLNENLAREIMELHTLGVGSGYSQADVTEFARTLTGWSIGAEGDDTPGAGQFRFRPQWHEEGPRSVLGRNYPGGGEAQAEAILVDLARHPATASHLARKLARHFVADDPPPALVDRLKAVYLDRQGRLDAVAAALIDSPEAWAPDQAKFKSPYEFVISAYRAVGTPPVDPARFFGDLDRLGQRPYAAPSPKGWPDDTGDWAAPDAIVNRMNWAELFGRAAGDGLDPMALASSALGARLGPRSQAAIAHAQTRPEAVALLLMSPEFQRR